MRESLIFDLLVQDALHKYRKELEAVPDDTYTKWINKDRKELEETLTKEQLKLVDSYKFHLYLLEEYVDFQVGIKVLNYGIKIGMEIQKAFDDEEE